MKIFVFTKALIEKSQYVSAHFKARYKFHTSRYEDLNFLSNQSEITRGIVFDLMKKYGYILDGGLFNEKLRLMKNFTQQKVAIQRDAYISLAKSLAARTINVVAAFLAILIVAPILPIIVMTDIVSYGLKTFYLYRPPQNKGFSNVTSVDENLINNDFAMDNKKPFFFTPKHRHIYKSFNSSMSKCPSIDESTESIYDDDNTNHLASKLKKSTDDMAIRINNTTKIKL